MHGTYDIAALRMQGDNLAEYTADLTMEPGTGPSLHDPGDPPEVLGISMYDEDGNQIRDPDLIDDLIDRNWDRICEALADAQAAEDRSK